MTLVLFRPFIVIDVHLPILDGSCCSFFILSDTRGVESIATPPNFYPFFQGTDDIDVISLLGFQNHSLILCILFGFRVITVSIGFCQTYYVYFKYFIALYVSSSV